MAHHGGHGGGHHGHHGGFHWLILIMIIREAPWIIPAAILWLLF